MLPTDHLLTRFVFGLAALLSIGNWPDVTWAWLSALGIVGAPAR